MVHLDPVAELMDDHIISHPGRGKHQQTVEIQIAAAAAAAPPALLVTDRDPSVADAGFTGKHFKTDKEAIAYIDNEKGFFYATRCYISIPGEQQFTLTPRHWAAGEVTSINDIAAANDIIDVYNVLGVRVAHNIKAGDVNNLDPNIYIVKGRKILVK